MNKHEQNRSLNDQKLNIKVARGGLFSSKTSPTLYLGIAAIICSLITPAMLISSQISELIGWIVCAICAFCAAICVKRFLALAALALLASFVISFTGSTASLALMIGPIFSIALISTLMSRKEQSTIMPAIVFPIIIYGLSLLITRDFIFSFISLYTLPSAIVLGIANKREASKSFATLAGTVAFTSVTVATIAVSIYMTYGTINSIVINTAANNLATSLNEYCEIAINAAGNAITAEIRQIISSATDTFINLLPGTIVASAYITSYLCQSISVTLSERIGEDAPKDNYITADLYTAVIFIIAYLFSFSSGASSGLSIEAVVGSNVALMLTPCLFIVGLRSLKLMPYKFGIIGVLFSIATIVMIFVSESSAFTIFALSGAVYTLINSVDAWAKQHYSKGENK